MGRCAYLRMYLFSQPLNRPEKQVDFASFNRKPPPSVGAPFHQVRGKLYLALLEDTPFPHLRPGLGGMTEHLAVDPRTLTLDWHSPVQAEDDRAGTGVK